MIRLVWCVCCTSSAIDRDSNQVSLFDIVEQLRGEMIEPPAPQHGNERLAIPGRFQLVNLWARRDPATPGSGLSRMRLVSPAGEQLLVSEHDIDLTEHQLRRVRINLMGLPYAGNGTYHFLVEQQEGGQWSIGADVPLMIDLATNLSAGPVETPTGTNPA